MIVSLHIVILLLETINYARGANTATNNVSSLKTSKLKPLCEQVEKVLQKTGKGACRCFENSEADYADEFMKNAHENFRNASMIPPWLACTRERMPIIYKALNALPEGTFFDKLWIWDSLVPIVPAKFFEKVKIRKLVMENDHLGEFMDDVLFSLSSHLQYASFKNNLIRSVKENLFRNMTQLQHLDLSFNLLSELNRSSFGTHLTNLRHLSLQNNQLIKVDTGAFDSLKNLKKLHLGSNNLVSLKSGVFSNLAKLETLILENNRLSSLPNRLFDGLIDLKILNLGGNQLSTLNLPMRMENLVHLYLHNNSFYSITEANFKIEPEVLKNLKTLHLDSNHLVSFDDDQFLKMPNLQVLSVASNALSVLQPNCFRNLHNLNVLSLQNNQLSEDTFNKPELFGNVPNLTKLYLSQNRLKMVPAEMFHKVINLRVLTLAHNLMDFLANGAFIKFTQLERLYFNDNNLINLHNSTLADLNRLPLKAIDISDNPWACSCSISKFINDHQAVIMNFDKLLCSDTVGCLITMDQACSNSSSMNKVPFDTLISLENASSYWITILGILLGIVSILILCSILLLYYQDGRFAELQETRANFLRRVPSDMVNLIPKCSNNIVKV